MAVVGDKMLDIVEHIKAELIAGMQELAAFVETIEKTDRLEASFSIPQEFSEMHERLVDVSIHFAKYTVLFPEIQEMVIQSTQLSEAMSERFRDWVEGKPKTINVKEAMVIHSRSRSTIYRWIRNGRLTAFKQGRFWCIVL